MRQQSKQSSSQVVRFTKATPAYCGGINFQHFVTIQKDGDQITSKALHLVIRMLERHVVLNTVRREKAWAVISNALSDALYPTKANGCTAADQEQAFAWLASDDAAELMDLVGLNHEYAMWVVSQLVGDLSEDCDDAISQAVAG